MKTKKTKSLSDLFAYIVLISSAIGLLGWLPIPPQMKETTALGFIFSALSLLFIKKIPLLANILAVIIFISAFSEFNEVYGINGMPETAACFVLFSFSILLKSLKYPIAIVLSELTIIFTAILSLLSLSGFLVGAGSLTDIIARYNSIGMPWHRAILFLCLGFSALAQANGQHHSLITSRNSGGIMIRRLVLLLLFSPVIIEVLIFLGRKLQVVHPHYFHPLSLLMVYCAFLLFSWVTAQKIEEGDKAKDNTQKRLKFAADLSFQLEETIDVHKRLEYAGNLIVRDFANWCKFNFKGESMIFSKEEASTNERQTMSWYMEEVLSDCLIQESLEKDGAARIDEALVFSINSRGKQFGLMILVNPKSSFTNEDFSLIKIISNRLAISLDNAQLFQDANRSIKDREDMIAIVSHDLKNPLSIIQLAGNQIERILKKDALENPDRIIQLLRKIQKSSETSLELISNLLLQSKMAVGKLLIEKHPENAEILVEEVLEEYYSQATHKKILLKNEAIGITHCLADRPRIMQVLSNLVNNAIKFTPEGGQVTVSAEYENNEVLFKVKDTGMGMSIEEMDRIFDRYWQPQHTQRQGTGLGLSIAKGIVEAHGGRIWIESNPRGGSMFCFTLPNQITINSDHNYDTSPHASH